MKCESKNAEQIFSTVLLVIFRDNLIPFVWKSIVPIRALKNLEKSKPDSPSRISSARKSTSRNSDQKYS